jgi:hypothetical protein
LPSLDRIVAYTSIVGGVCTPPILFFAASGFFQWTPSTFMGLGIMSAPVGTAVIALILGGCPWAVVGYTYRHKRRRLPLSVASADAPKQTPAELQYRPINGIELLEFMESAKLASAADAFFTPTPVKILYSDKGHDVADQLARALILLNFEVMVNHDNRSLCHKPRRRSARGPPGRRSGTNSRLANGPILSGSLLPFQETLGRARAVYAPSSGFRVARQGIPKPVLRVRIHPLHHSVHQFSDLSENRSKSARVRAICDRAWLPFALRRRDSRPWLV